MMFRVISLEAGEDIRGGQLVTIQDKVAYPIKAKWIEVPRSLKVKSKRGHIRVRHKPLPPHIANDPSWEPPRVDGMALSWAEKGEKVPIETL